MNKILHSEPCNKIRPDMSGHGTVYLIQLYRKNKPCPQIKPDVQIYWEHYYSNKIKNIFLNILINYTVSKKHLILIYKKTFSHIVKFSKFGLPMHN